MADEQISNWARIRYMLRAGDSDEELEALLDSMGPVELLHAAFHLTDDEQRSLLSIVSPERAAELIEEMPEGHAADLIEDMPAEQVAPIVEEMASDLRVDVLAELDQDDADAILDQLEEEDALEIRELSVYPRNVAGGLMMTEFMSYPMNLTVRQVLEDLTSREGDYGFLTVHYIYVVVKKHKLKGVIRIRDLVFGDPNVKISTIVTPALTVSADADLQELEHFFDEHDIAAVPVVDARDNLLGLVRRRSLLEALTEKSEADNLKAAGIVGGDELRSMPVLIRSRRRLAWLSINIGLNILAASIIAIFSMKTR